jgi:hypothetical protein
VFKDGQNVEQGNHGGLNETVGGYQIDDPIPIHDQPVTEDIDATLTRDTAELLAEASEAPVDQTGPVQDTVWEGTRPQAALHRTSPRPLLWLEPKWTLLTGSGGLPTSDSAPLQANPVAFPTSDSGPVSFPGSTSDQAASQKAPSVTQAPGITREVGTPERTGTLDSEPESERSASASLRRISSDSHGRSP